MNRLQKCELAIELGFDYNELSGEIITPTAKIVRKTTNNGYLTLTLRDSSRKVYYLYAHHFAWYLKKGEIVEIIDHEDRNKKNNRFYNLRSVSKQVNALNTNAKGVYFDVSGNKWVAKIVLEGKANIIGRFIKKEDALIAYKSYKNKIIKKLINKH